MAFMRMIPACQKDQWDDTSYREVLRDVLGLPSLRWYDPRLRPAQQQHTMPHLCPCGHVLTARHADSCILDGTISLKHNAIARDIFKCALAHKIPAVEMEPRGTLNRGPNSGPDIKLTSKAFGEMMLDFTYVDETAETYNPRAFHRAAHAASAAEAKKVNGSRDQPECQNQGIAYAGIAMEHGGAYGPALAALLKRMWQYVKNPGRANRTWTLLVTSAMPLDKEYDNPLWTAPALTEFHVQRISNTARLQTIDARRKCADRLNNGIFGGVERPHARPPAGPHGRHPAPAPAAAAAPPPPSSDGRVDPAAAPGSAGSPPPPAAGHPSAGTTEGAAALTSTPPDMASPPPPMPTPSSPPLVTNPGPQINAHGQAASAAEYVSVGRGASGLASAGAASM